MKVRFGLALTAAALVGGFGFMVSHAGAQQPGPPPKRTWSRAFPPMTAPPFWTPV